MVSNTDEVKAPLTRVHDSFASTGGKLSQEVFNQLLVSVGLKSSGDRKCVICFGNTH